MPHTKLLDLGLVPHLLTSSVVQSILAVCRAVQGHGRRGRHPAHRGLARAPPATWSRPAPARRSPPPHAADRAGPRGRAGLRLEPSGRAGERVVGARACAPAAALSSSGCRGPDGDDALAPRRAELGEYGPDRPRRRGDRGPGGGLAGRDPRPVQRVPQLDRLRVRGTGHHGSCDASNRTGAQLAAVMDAAPASRPTRPFPARPGPCSSRASTRRSIATAAAGDRRPPTWSPRTRRTSVSAQFTRVMRHGRSAPPRPPHHHRPAAGHGAAARRRRPRRPPTWPPAGPAHLHRPGRRGDGRRAGLLFQQCRRRLPGPGRPRSAGSDFPIRLPPSVWVPAPIARPRSAQPSWPHGRDAGRLAGAGPVPPAGHHGRRPVAAGRADRRAGHCSVADCVRAAVSTAPGPTPTVLPPDVDGHGRRDRDQLRDRARVGRRRDPDPHPGRPGGQRPAAAAAGAGIAGDRQPRPDRPGPCPCGTRGGPGHTYALTVAAAAGRWPGGPASYRSRLTPSHPPGAPIRPHGPRSRKLRSTSAVEPGPPSGRPERDAGRADPPDAGASGIGRLVRAGGVDLGLGRASDRIDDRRV